MCGMSIKNWLTAGIASIAILTSLVGLPKAASAQVGWNSVGTDCTACGETTGVCTCTVMKPVCQTTMARQDCVITKDVPVTGYRQEQYVVQVPCTSYDTITVDEGCYKMVWVPKPVKKIIPKTVFNQEVRTRQVPFTYNKKVAQVTAQWVPQQTIRYVPQIEKRAFRQPFYQRGACPTGGCTKAPFCNTCQPFTSQIPSIVPSYPAQPSCDSCGVNAGGGPVPNPTPDPYMNPGVDPTSGNWQTIPRRAAMNQYNPQQLAMLRQQQWQQQQLLQQQRLQQLQLQQQRVAQAQAVGAGQIQQVGHQVPAGHGAYPHQIQQPVQPAALFR